MTKTVILIIGIFMIVLMATMAILIPQIMLKNVSRRVSKFKRVEGIPLKDYEVEITGRRCLSVEEGRVSSVKKADDCELLIRFLEENIERYILVPYGVYLYVQEGDQGVLTLQNGEYRDFREKRLT